MSNMLLVFFGKRARQSLSSPLSPLHPQVETPKESQLSNICVLAPCEITRVLEEASEEDRPQRRSSEDAGEEQSSTTGGSSCTSAPALDGHQGGSSALVFSDDKCQTPTLHCPTPLQRVVLSQSESTLPLVESEERLDRPPRQATGEEGSQQEALESLDFCPVVVGPIPASLPSSYMPQRSGYRPQRWLGPSQTKHTRLLFVHFSLMSTFLSIAIYNEAVGPQKGQSCNRGAGAAADEWSVLVIHLAVKLPYFLSNSVI